MSRKQKKLLLRILTAAGLLVALALLPLDGPLALVCYLLPYLTVGWDILWKALKGIINRQLLDENFLMAVATLGALVLALTGGGDYTEAVAVMLFYQTGELFQSYALGKSRRNIAKLMDIRPDWAHVRTGSGLQTVDPEEVAVGSLLQVNPGERVPIDGTVVEGFSSLNTAALTGESLPQDVAPGDSIISGCINLTGVLTLRTTRPYGESTVARILDLVENASSRKSRSEAFITRFARVYTPAVCLSALALALVPPLFLGGWATWLYRALTFLVVSCPCALVISIPLTFFAGLGGASSAGILIKGSNYLEALAKTETLVLDKTGTLTQGEFAVVGIYPASLAEERLLELAAHAEFASSHPISLSLRRAWGKPVGSQRVSQVREISGLGVTALVDGIPVACGSSRLLDRLGIGHEVCPHPGTAVYVAANGVYAGCIRIADRLKPTAAPAIKALKKAGVHRLVMLTGDRPDAAGEVARTLGIPEVHSQLLPQDKVAKVESLLAQTQGVLAFVGDGINDAPVLARADIGIAMGALGSDAAIEAADVVLMDDDPQKLSKAIAISRKSMAIVKQNTVLAIGIKLGCLLLTALGISNMWLAIFADVGVMVLAVWNAIRALYVPKA